MSADPKSLVFGTTCLADLPLSSPQKVFLVNQLVHDTKDSLHSHPDPEYAVSSRAALLRRFEAFPPRSKKHLMGLTGRHNPANSRSLGQFVGSAALRTLPFQGFVKDCSALRGSFRLAFAERPRGAADSTFALPSPSATSAQNPTVPPTAHAVPPGPTGKNLA